MTLARLQDRVREYALLIRFDRPIGTFLLLWPTLWALWMAGRGAPERWIVVVFVAGVFLMRSAGCVMNDIADRDLDPHVARTRERPLAAGRVSLREAVVLFLALCLAAFALVLLLNRLTVALSVVAVLLAVSYPFMKRFHHLPQAHLGAAFGWSVPMAFAALTEAVPPLAWLLFLATLVWSVVYDTMYAMADREDDLKIGIKSSAILFGRRDRAIIGALQGLLLALLAAAGALYGAGWGYALGLAGAAGFGIYQQWLIRERDPQACFQAFLNNHYVGLAVFCGILLDALPAG